MEGSEGLGGESKSSCQSKTAEVEEEVNKRPDRGGGERRVTQGGEEWNIYRA